jgi:hypothetical protein
MYMSSSTRRIFFGVALILIGGLFLAKEIFNLPFHLGGIMIAAIFALAGAAFLFVLATNREQWWAAIPGMVLMGLALLIASSEFFPQFSQRFGGSLFLGFIGLAFLLVYLMKHQNWWAIIPMGVMLTLAIVAGMGSYNGLASGATFFMGIGATFAIIGLMPIGRSEKWPWIPAGICAVLGTMLMIGSGAFLNSVAGLIWPAILVIAGGFMIVRTFLKKNE